MKILVLTMVAVIMQAQCALAYVGNLNTYKFHEDDCYSVERMADHNKYHTNNRKELMDMGMVPCKKCWP